MASSDPIILSRDQGERIGRVVTAFETGKLRRSPYAVRRYSSPIVVSSGDLDILLMASRPYTGFPNRWEYAWAQSIRQHDSPRLWIIKPGGLTSTVDGDPFALAALNGYENPNDGLDIEGHGVLIGTVGGSVRQMEPVWSDGTFKCRLSITQDDGTPPASAYTIHVVNPLAVGCA